MPRRGRALLDAIAGSDRTFTWLGGRWRGKCLICNGWLSFDPRDGEGVNVEHIVPRVRGGATELANLALTHPRCNGEKGRRWDNSRRPERAAAYAALIERLQAERRARWREPDEEAGGGATPPGGLP
jgi:hypothetical protein